MKTINFCFKIGVPSKRELHQWGDYHLIRSFGEALKNKGHHYEIQILPEWHTDRDFDADIIVHVRGLSKYQVKPHHFNIMWNISHPSKIDFDEYNQYDLVLVASETYSEQLKDKLSVPVQALHQFVDTKLFYPDRNKAYQSELLFVGNSRGVMREIIRDILPPPKSLTVYGGGWKGLIPDQYIKNEYFPNEKLRILYSSCNILLNDHWEDMKSYGFINNRIFDAYACKSIVISDSHSELEKLFPHALTYNSRKGLLELIQDIFERKNYYSELTETLYCQTVEDHTVNRRVDQFLEILSNFNLQKQYPKAKQQKSVKKVANEFLLTRLGYGKTYRLLHKSYHKVNTIKSQIKQISIILQKAKIKLFNEEGLHTLLNMASEAEIKALATRLAVPYQSPQLVSIIIPTKNGVHHLRHLVPHLMINTLIENYEVLIIDNNSNDSTKRFTEGINDPHFKFINTARDLNFSETINFGVKHARGDIFVFLNNDVVPLFGWLDELLRAFRSEDNVGIVGSRLIYNHQNKLNKHGEVLYPGCSIQHDGIKINWSHNGLMPYNTGKYRNPLDTNHESWTEEVPAVTAACMLTDRQTFEAVNGFNEDYQFGKEDVDYSLKVRKYGKKILIHRRSLLFHREFASQTKRSKRSRKMMRIRNNEIFNKLWFKEISSEIWKEKIYNRKQFWSETPLNICFLVTENRPDTTAGDFFSAYGLGSSLKERYGYEVSYLPRRPIFEWNEVPESTDIVIIMRHDCDIRKLNISPKTLKVAWVRGYVKEWLAQPWVDQFNGLVFSTDFALQIGKTSVDNRKIWGALPLAITSEFSSVREFQRDIDVSFVGNIFEVPRDIVKCLDLSQSFDFHFYGRLEAEKNHPWRPYHKGSIEHGKVPQIYGRSKIVIEDTAPFNAGTINLRVFEAAAGGALVISNFTEGLTELFGESVLIYRDKEHLTELISYYLNHEDERAFKAEQARQIVFDHHTFYHRAATFKKLLEERFLYFEVEKN
ncbi:glycosyltransferase family protein [Paenibacillus humicola]|uniref:glycosyltransferase family protein n=1 Tax=Paenibacillus humicola TaxID=3110540 RepID=UPI00237A455C|nr:glycosyltransferase [Paenibacillus humicola]